MRSSTPTALMEIYQKKEIRHRGEGGDILFCVSEFCRLCVESIPSKDVYVFFILRRRVQRYRTAVRDDKNKKHIHRRRKTLCVQNKIYYTRRHITPKAPELHSFLFGFQHRNGGIMQNIELIGCDFRKQLHVLSLPPCNLHIPHSKLTYALYPYAHRLPLFRGSGCRQNAA